MSKIVKITIEWEDYYQTLTGEPAQQWIDAVVKHDMLKMGMTEWEKRTKKRLGK